MALLVLLAILAIILFGVGYAVRVDLEAVGGLADVDGGAAQLVVLYPDRQPAGPDPHPLHAEPAKPGNRNRSDRDPLSGRVGADPEHVLEQVEGRGGAPGLRDVGQEVLRGRRVEAAVAEEAAVELRELEA